LLADESLADLLEDALLDGKIDGETEDLAYLWLKVNHPSEQQGVSVRKLLHSIVLLLVISSASQASELTGKVVGIADGDTFTLLTADKQQVKIRLAEIDAPESGQPYGNKSKQALSGLVFGKDVRVVVQTTDRYGRTVGRPYVGDLDVCAEMVRMGAAWAYRDYLRDRSLLPLSP
jgi:endonuclease YncB( thermonuclease family)